MRGKRSSAASGPAEITFGGFDLRSRIIFLLVLALALAGLQLSAGVFAASAAQLKYTGPNAVSTGDVATYTATLRTASGAPIAGARVTFTLGAEAPVSGLTNAKGVARAMSSRFIHAGTFRYTLAVAYGGGAKAGPAVRRVPFTVSAPNTRVGLSKLMSGGGEPSETIGRDGTIWVANIGSGDRVFKSTDNGATWKGPMLPSASSGDNGIATDESGAVYDPNLNGIGAPPDGLQAVVHKSTDGGKTWIAGKGPLPFGSSTSTTPFGVDRPWVDATIPAGKTTDEADVYLFYHDFWGISQVWSSTSTDGGKTFGLPVPVAGGPSVMGVQAAAAALCNTIPGRVKIDKTSGPHHGRVYVEWLAGDPAANLATGCNYTQLQTFHQLWIAYSDDLGKTWTDQLVYDAGVGHDGSGIFPHIVLDNQGNPYVTFSMNIGPEFDTYVMASFDYGKTWNGKSDGTGKPYQVNGDTGTHFYPVITAGNPGEVSVAYLGTDKVIPLLPYGKPKPGGGAGDSWYLYVGQSLDLRGGNPTWTVTRATPNPMHVGDICTLGIACVGALGSNRSLADFIDIGVDRNGLAHVSFTDDATLGGIVVANQISGIRIGRGVS